MAKEKLRRVTEPDTGMVHYAAIGVMDAVTLCGHSDWLGETTGVETDSQITCRCCATIVSRIQRAQKEELRRL